MKSRSQSIRELLIQAFAPDHLEVVDDSWKHAGHAGAREHGGGHFRIRIVSAKFAGKTRMEQHRMVYQALTPLLRSDIHALSISTDVPEAHQ